VSGKGTPETMRAPGGMREARSSSTRQMGQWAGGGVVVDFSAEASRVMGRPSRKYVWSNRLLGFLNHVSYSSSLRVTVSFTYDGQSSLKQVNAHDR
jgi:hypothetical protein